MKTWTEIEQRFRKIAAQDPELELICGEGEKGSEYRLMHRHPIIAREMRLLANCAGKLLARNAAKFSAAAKDENYEETWWRFLKTNSQAVVKFAHGGFREIPNGEIYYN